MATGYNERGTGGALMMGHARTGWHFRRVLSELLSGALQTSSHQVLCDMNLPGLTLTFVHVSANVRIIDFAQDLRECEPVFM